MSIIKSLPSSNSKVRDGVVVGLEDLGVVENLVTERVEPVQGHSDVRGRHPVLQETQHGSCLDLLKEKPTLSPGSAGVSRPPR